jgi:large subunit ribosomal protein L32e
MAKPNFVVKESHYQPRVKKRWRLPRGRHSGVRQYHKGKPAMPTPGYGASAATRGLQAGLKPVVVESLSGLKIAEKEGVIISATLGNRKKLQLLEQCLKDKIPVLNHKDIAASIKVIKDDFTQRQEQKKARVASKSKKEVEKKKKADEKAKTDDKAKKTDKDLESAVDGQTQAKKDAEKTIIKKQ